MKKKEPKQTYQYYKMLQPRFVERHEDMSPEGTLKLIMEPDGDMIVVVKPDPDDPMQSTVMGRRLACEKLKDVDEAILRLERVFLNDPEYIRLLELRSEQKELKKIISEPVK